MSSHEPQRAQHREYPEPSEGGRPVPWFVVAWIGVLILWGIGYYAWHIGWPLTGGDSRTAVEQAAPGAAVDGEKLFTAQCSACHQPTGQGVPGTFPPLAGSEWMQGDPALVVAIVHDGLQGPITVAGEEYQGSMPAFADKLSPDELAAVLSHERQAWGNEGEPVDSALVKKHEERFAERGAWTVDELRNTFPTPE
ncbi:cytochrome c [Halomonas sp. 11-S5]|uniref:c-type cytochrome n=1 Tax=Halomonas sp. 11-S5 TaxID=2994064 RepID=UPI002469477F|nr:cytochrome c [Halomonas sp. 11-S5]